MGGDGRGLGDEASSIRVGMLKRQRTGAVQDGHGGDGVGWAGESTRMGDGGRRESVRLISGYVRIFGKTEGRWVPADAIPKTWERRFSEVFCLFVVIQTIKFTSIFQHMCFALTCLDFAYPLISLARPFVGGCMLRGAEGPKGQKRRKGGRRIRFGFGLRNADFGAKRAESSVCPVWLGLRRGGRANRTGHGKGSRDARTGGSRPFPVWECQPPLFALYSALFAFFTGDGCCCGSQTCGPGENPLTSAYVRLQLAWQEGSFIVGRGGESYLSGYADRRPLQ